MQPSPLANPLATVQQLQTSASQLDGIPADLEDSIRFAGARLTQAVGILLRLPQEIIAQAIIVFMRFLVGPEGGSLARHGAEDVSMGAMYLATKLSAWPKSARSVINVYAYLNTFAPTFIDAEELGKKQNAEDYYVSEGTFQIRRGKLFEMEQVILKTVGFQLQVSLPYSLCITYLQALDIFAHPRASELANRANAHLNTALLSPQLLYLTHQPPTLAAAAIYLAAKEVAIKLPDVEWWEVFDTDREELGFLVVGLLSVESFAVEERSRWEGMRVPMAVDELDEEIKRRAAADGEE
ncbi:cyclin-like protein [Lophiotrema nucula]|uniref:Cyclin-like protein n=1 Tax=Lophiotrema nucula TaxID=690887 RepID=A0A6A5ZAG9_9PLEO|nr:cyclin-like protein [Lophiotrema nucula]